jgi:hypothetical protein
MSLVPKAVSVWYESTPKANRSRKGCFTPGQKAVASVSWRVVTGAVTETILSMRFSLRRKSGESSMRSTTPWTLLP